MGLMDLPVKIALGKVKDSVINPQLEGIGVLEELAWKDGHVRGILRLADLEDQPIEIDASDIVIAPDGSSVRIGSFQSNKKFVANAVKRFALGKEFPIPEGGARTVALTAKKLLKL